MIANLLILRAALITVEHFRHAMQIVEQRFTYLNQRMLGFATADRNHLIRLASFQHDAVPVFPAAQQFISAHFRRIGQGAPDQEKIEETHLVRVDADG